MAYNDIERSEYNNHPVELYAFTRGSLSWLYTSADSDITFEGRTYLTVPISRGRIEASSDLGKISIKIVFADTVEIVRQYIPFSPTDVIDLVITRFHQGAPESVIPWRGRVTNVSFRQDRTAEMVCQPLYASLRRPGLRRVYQTTCPHVLYNAPCNALRNDFRTVAFLSAVNQRFNYYKPRALSYLIRK